jgi:hypothetical protein
MELLSALQRLLKQFDRSLHARETNYDPIHDQRSFVCGVAECLQLLSRLQMPVCPDHQHNEVFIVLLKKNNY